MIITPINYIRKIEPVRGPKRTPVSFCALKSDTFSPSQDYETNRKARDKFYEITDLNKYYSKFDRDNIDRIYRLDIWKENLKRNYYDKNPVLALQIFESITSALSLDNHEQPPIFNGKVLNTTIEFLKGTENFQSAFKKTYENTLRHYIISGECEAGKTDTTWVKIPSKQTAPENFHENLEKLKILSSRKWCTKATHSQAYLEQGDFYIYYSNGEPKLFIHASDKQIKAIQCGGNSGILSYKYADIIEEFIKSEHLTAGRNELIKLQKAKDTKTKFLILKETLSTAIKENNQVEIFKAAGIETKRNSDGTLTISHYGQPDEGFTYKDLGIDENRLLKNVTEIEGNADFIRSNATIANELKKIGQDANFMYSKIKSLNNLEYIGRLANFLNMPNLTVLPNLQYVGEKLAISRSINIPKLIKGIVLYF